MRAASPVNAPSVLDAIKIPHGSDGPHPGRPRPAYRQPQPGVGAYVRLAHAAVNCHDPAAAQGLGDTGGGVDRGGGVMGGSFGIAIGELPMLSPQSEYWRHCSVKIRELRIFFPLLKNDQKWSVWLFNVPKIKEADQFCAKYLTQTHDTTRSMLEPQLLLGFYRNLLFWQ